MGAKQWLGAMCIAWGMVGCAGGVDEAEPTLQSRVAELTSPNGRNLNGRNLNGSELDGTNLGQMLVSVSFAGAQRGGAEPGPFGTVWLEGSTFHGLANGSEISGMAFLGARFSGNLGSGGTVDLRVDDIVPSTGPQGDIWNYRVSYFNAEQGQWRPVCTDANGSAANAIPVKGRWNYGQGVTGGGSKVDDPSVFTFACEGAAIAKCIHFGYRPWAKLLDGSSVAPLHQACTRMVRADFCGDGTSYTVDGQWVNLFDGSGIQGDTEEWQHEAEWDTDGARCFASRTRAQNRPVTCAAQREALPSCGARAHFRTGTLLMSEIPPEDFTDL